mmetsp:Transcript_10688/g.39955  ORF Transcript_10688/g.39955 Transcript_10688/m.39955 type:complete len:87 (+) Transcript_10688:2383-2643(+)
MWDNVSLSITLSFDSQSQIQSSTRYPANTKQHITQQIPRETGANMAMEMDVMMTPGTDVCRQEIISPIIATQHNSMIVKAQQMPTV